MKNGKSNNWEARLTRLEDDVRQIKSMFEKGPSKRGWQAMVGVFADDPVYADIRRVTMDLIEKERERDKRRMSRRAAKVKK